MGTVRYAGRDESGDPLFDIHIDFPDPSEWDPPATARQAEAVGAMFGPIDGLTASQATAALDARDYGRQCAAKLLARQPARVRDMVAVVIAAWIMADQARLADVCAWGARRFATQPDGSAISRTKRFADVREWLASIDLAPIG